MGRRLNENAMIIPQYDCSICKLKRRTRLPWGHAHIYCNMHRNQFSLNYRHSISDIILKSDSTASWDRKTTICLPLEDFPVVQVIVGCKETWLTLSARLSLTGKRKHFLFSNTLGHEIDWRGMTEKWGRATGARGPPSSLSCHPLEIWTSPSRTDRHTWLKTLPENITFPSYNLGGW